MPLRSLSGANLDVSDPSDNGIAQFRFEAEALKEQIAVTFSHRGTEIPASVPKGLSEEFAQGPDAQTQWRAFVRRNEAEGAPEDFSEVVAGVREFVSPVLNAAVADKSLRGRWSPGEGWV